MFSSTSMNGHNLHSCGLDQTFRTNLCMIKATLHSAGHLATTLTHRLARSKFFGPRPLLSTRTFQQWQRQMAFHWRITYDFHLYVVSWSENEMKRLVLLLTYAALSWAALTIPNQVDLDSNSQFIMRWGFIRETSDIEMEWQEHHFCSALSFLFIVV